VNTDAADSALPINDGDLLAQFGGTDGTLLASGTAADYNQIVFVVLHGASKLAGTSTAKCLFFLFNFCVEDSEQASKADLPHFIGRVYHCSRLGRDGMARADEKLTIS
jgi:hypothetical protein